MIKRRGKFFFLILILLLIIAVIGVKGIQRVINSNEHKDVINKTTIQPFGENVYVFSPADDPAKVQEIIDQTWAKQETNQFGTNRYTFLFLPGKYDDSIEVKVGYYTQVSGLGTLPTDTVIPKLTCDATWLGDDSNHNATCNFWRGVENITMNSNTLFAVSQATYMRRVQINGSLSLHDNNGWSSGGFLADSNIEGVTDSGSQQQWISRNSSVGTWIGQNWNMVFVGVKEGEAPNGTWPATKYTTIEKTPVIQEKPFLIYDNEQGYGVFVPNKRENSADISWNTKEDGTIIPMNKFYIASPEADSADTINAALEDQKHLLLTPGIYELDKPIVVNNPNTVVLGLGYATLQPTKGNACMEVANVDGIKIAGILFDAGTVESNTLLQVGAETSSVSHAEHPILLSDLFFRVGGTDTDKPTKVVQCVILNSNDIIGDNFWVWRADHGDEVAWDKNTAKNGILINGDHVTMYGLMVEHFQEYQTIWNGNDGRTYFYQSEIPYDVPNQTSWVSHNGSVNGFASYKVGEQVTSHQAFGIGIYSYHRDAKVDLNSVMEVPDRDGVAVHNICSIMITGHPGISHVINNSGEAAIHAGDRKIIVEYQNGIIK